MASSAGIPIKSADLAHYSRRASHLLAKVRYTPQKSVAVTADGSFADGDKRYRPSTVDHPKTEEVSIYKTAQSLSDDLLLLSEEANHALHIVRRGIQLGMHLSDLYSKTAGLESLESQNKRGLLTDDQKTEFRRKNETASAITIFVTASYITWELTEYRADDVGQISMEFQTLPELNLLSPVQALNCALYYFAAYAERGAIVQTSLEFVKWCRVYFEAVIDEVRNRLDSLHHIEQFTSRSYLLEDGDFAVNGFEVEKTSGARTVEFNRIRWDQIVGNVEAKHKSERIAQRLACFDTERGLNPFLELGGMPNIRMGYGKPGTGKSMLIAALATRLQELCDFVQLPFLFHPMPDTIVSTFQGGSAERMTDWMRPLRDANKIIYAPIDDAENNLEERTRQGVSSGVREVIGVFLRNTEGAYAVQHGNTLIDLMTNIPEQMDKAVLSRIRDRFLIAGAETAYDYLDQDRLWWQKYEGMDAKFINMAWPKGYEFLENQQRLTSLGTAYERVQEPQDNILKNLFEQSAKKYKHNDHLFFGELFYQVGEAIPFFKSRDVRNIQSAISERIMDFDLPEVWFNNPEQFFWKDYDTKKNMIVEVMKSNLGGLSFAELRLQEAIRYLDNLVNISEADRQRRLEETVEQMEIREEATRMLSQRQLDNG